MNKSEVIDMLLRVKEISHKNEHGGKSLFRIKISIQQLCGGGGHGMNLEWIDIPFNNLPDNGNYEIRGKGND